MKKIILLLIILFNINLHAQTNKYKGSYETTFDINNDGVITYTLILNPDGTFTFHNYRQIDPSQPKENSYGKGTWKIEKNNTLYFYTNITTDLDDEFTIDFSNTKARYHTKSPRDKTDKMMKTKLHFYNSEIPWLKGWKLFKI